MKTMWKKLIARHNKIQNKIFFPFVGTMVLIGVLIVYLMTDLVLKNVETRVNDKLNNDVRLIQEIVTDMEKSMAFYAQFMADTEKLAGHISEARDSRLVLIYLLDFLRENQISSNIGSVDAPIGGDTKLGRLGMLGIRTTGLLSRKQGEDIRLSLSAVAPVEGHTSNRSIITVSREMDREFLRELVKKTGAHEIQIYYNGRLVESSSVPEDRCESEELQFLTPELFDRTMSSAEPFFAELFCGGHSLRMALVPLTVNFNTEAFVAVFENMDDIAKAKSNIILTTLMVVGLMFLVVVPMYIFTVLFTVSPIRELSQASKAIAEGRLDQHVPVKTGDEVGELSASFNKMIDDLKKYREDIESMNQTLEQRVEKRTRELADAQAQLIQSSKLAAVGELAAGIAHELNNPLAGIYAFLQVFAQTLRSRGLKELSAEEARDFQENLVHVEREIRRCKSIIGSLLMFARVSEKRYGPVDLNRTILDTLAFMRSSLGKSNVKIETHLEEGLAPVWGDANELQQVFLNIIVNARKAMPQGGDLAITTGVKDGGHSVCISISDTGVGIDAETLEKIFDPFFTTSRPGDGTGLGLSISYGIIKDHSGEILVESHPGQGSTFKIVLPIMEAREGEDASAAEASVASRGGTEDAGH